jgi:hypothetical protein
LLASIAFVTQASNFTETTYPVITKIPVKNAPTNSNPTEPVSFDLPLLPLFTVAPAPVNQDTHPLDSYMGEVDDRTDISLSMSSRQALNVLAIYLEQIYLSF